MFLLHILIEALSLLLVLSLVAMAIEGGAAGGGRVLVVLLMGLPLTVKKVDVLLVLQSLSLCRVVQCLGSTHRRL